jgi:hypothetical protein
MPNTVTSEGCWDELRRPVGTVCDGAYEGCVTADRKPRLQVPMVGQVWVPGAPLTNIYGCVNAARHPQWEVTNRCQCNGLLDSVSMPQTVTLQISGAPSTTWAWMNGVWGSLPRQYAEWIDGTRGWTWKFELRYQCQQGLSLDNTVGWADFWYSIGCKYVAETQTIFIMRAATWNDHYQHVPQTLYTVVEDMIYPNGQYPRPPWPGYPYCPCTDPHNWFAGEGGGPMVFRHGILRPVCYTAPGDARDCTAYNDKCWTDYSWNFTYLNEAKKIWEGMEAVQQWTAGVPWGVDWWVCQGEASNNGACDRLGEQKHPLLPLTIAGAAAPTAPGGVVHWEISE